MELVEVDLLQPPPPQAALTRLTEVFRAAVRLPAARTGSQEAALGRDDQAVRIRVQGLGDERLAHLRAVGIGRVDEVDVQFQRPAQGRLGLLAVRWLPPDPWARDPHRAVAQPVNREVATDVYGAGRRGRRVSRHEVLLARTWAPAFQFRLKIVRRGRHCGPKTRVTERAITKSKRYNALSDQISVWSETRSDDNTGDSCGGPGGSGQPGSGVWPRPAVLPAGPRVGVRGPRADPAPGTERGRPGPAVPARPGRPGHVAALPPSPGDRAVP